MMDRPILRAAAHALHSHPRRVVAPSGDVPPRQGSPTGVAPSASFDARSKAFRNQSLLPLTLGLYEEMGHGSARLAAVERS